MAKPKKNKLERPKQYKGSPSSYIIPCFLVLLIIVISYAFLQFSDLLTFIAFIILVPIFVNFKFNGKIPIGFAVIMFIIAAIVLIISANPTTTGITAANVFAIYAFWLTVSGIICLIFEYRENGKKNAKK